MRVGSTWRPLLEPVGGAADIDHRLAHALKQAADVRAQHQLAALKSPRRAAAVVREKDEHGGDALGGKVGAQVTLIARHLGAVAVQDHDRRTRSVIRG